jgi:hypothetical protein
MVLQVQLDRKEFKDHPVFKDPQVPKVNKDHPELPVLRVFKDPQVLKVTRGLLV